MPLARINDRLIYFAHIPKTGGTSIEAYLAQKGPVALLQRSARGWARCTAQHLPRAVYADRFRDGFYDTGFAVVRDPKARLISEYRMRLALAAAAPRPPIARRLLGRGGVPEFDAWVCRIFARYRRDPYVNDNHIRPQVEFVHPGHRLFRFEAGLEPVFDWIDAVTGTPSGDRRNHRKRGEPVAVRCSPATDAAIRAFYRDDYALVASLGG